MKFATVYIPETSSRIMSDLQQRLYNSFGGYTVHARALGTYRDKHGSCCMEHVYPIVVVIQADQQEELEAILLEYKVEANQEAVLYIIDNEPIFL